MAGEAEIPAALRGKGRGNLPLRLPSPLAPSQIFPSPKFRTGGGDPDLVERILCLRGPQKGRRSGRGGASRTTDFRPSPSSAMTEDCIGAIDGTHVTAKVPRSMSTTFHGRKHYTSQNVLAAVDFDMWFTYVLARKRTPDDAEELLAKIGRNHDDWSTPEPTPTPIVKKRGMIKLNDEDMREAKKSLKEKGIKPEDVKNLPPIEDLCEITPPSSMIEDPLYPEGHPKRVEQDSQLTKTSAPSKKKKKKHKNVVESSEPVNDPNSISISDAETESGNEHDKDNDKDDTPDKEEVEKEPEKHAKNKKYTKEDFIVEKHAIRVPRWGSCEKVRGTPQELSNLYTMICNGRSFSDDGGKISSIQQPSIRYFAYFVTKCVLARRKGWSITENELNAYIERESHRAREGMEEAEEHPDSSSDAASSSYQHYGHVEPPRHSSAQGPYYHSMYDPPAWNSDPRWE
ncbi:hypothetical protein QYE76_023407 [Lolium multiflorum]|uniref:Uncharacterized protein n=1 Tax=Lolium multiflorum TaxID=4521 RepID=A0AAD8RBL5_LOLMU|nr:hypothetical protein QYE76_023407 [Lolium multiflorum]